MNFASNDIPNPAFLAQTMVKNGACICWSSSILTVPIPLIDIRFQNETLFTWATIQTPFGDDNPLFGVIRFAELRQEGGGLTFWDEQGHAVCAIFPNNLFGFPTCIEDELNTKAHNHVIYLYQDSEYFDMWAQRFVQGTEECLKNGQTHSCTTGRTVP
jgi:hypothetical protein